MAPDAIGVVIEIEGHILYFTGDTSFQKAIISEAASFRPEVSIVSINGRFGNMNEREGALAAVMTGARAAIPCHFWTFAEHGGDPGVFCRELSEEKECRAVCFRQGEIMIISRNGELQQRR